MNSLPEALERFNRKERNLLVRAALGHRVQRQPLRLKPLYLDGNFRSDVAKKLQIANGIPKEAWWGTDYHINWLAGALAIFATSSDDRRVWDNNSTMITGDQEDIDLVIAFGSELILIEAKGVISNFRNARLDNKLKRLELVREFYKRISPASSIVNFHFLLMSPLKRKPKGLSTEKWPEWAKWACKGGKVPYWLPLPLGENLLEVGRCDCKGKRVRNEQHWKIFKS
jgi:hypothetical protein